MKNLRSMLVLASAAALALACTERATTNSPVTPPPSRARLALSDSSAAVGASVDVFAQSGLEAPAVVGSFTARISYDTSSLRLDRELPIDDGFMRVSNAGPGLIRIAGAATNGFTAGQLAAYRFIVLRANGTAALQVVVDEMHTVDRATVQP
ncbi:MAG: hypothetical protein ABIY52_00085 [Gemmatimonadaceae bacterium]